MDTDAKLTMFAVGDDDQNIYAFKGSSVYFIRRFEQDYEARPAFLTDNYRSTQHNNRGCQCGHRASTRSHEAGQ